MDWTKEIGSGGGDGGWRDDFPLDHELQDHLEVDFSRLRLPVHPMFAVRVRVFIDWHRREGRDVRVIPPSDLATLRFFDAMGIDPDRDREAGGDAVMPVTRLREFNDVEAVAERTQEILEFQLPDVSPLGAAVFMAVSELCGNAIDHGDNSLGAYAAACRVTSPRNKVSVAISDLGIGVPEHIRQRYPEWGEDGWAIAHATEDRVTGTGDPHRGFGFSAVFEAALTRALHSAEMEILAANGHCRIEIVQENRKVRVFPASKFRRGTWIAYDLISV